MNLSYLKKYVLLHPENRMAWYLLGKEYEKNEQIGKANYCYNKAGHIYEAFESSKVPAEVWEEYQAKLMEATDHKERRTRRIRRAWLAVVLLQLLWIPSVAAPKHVDHNSDLTMDAYIERDLLTIDSYTNDDGRADRIAVDFTAKAWGRVNSDRDVIGEFMSSMPSGGLTGVLAMRQQGSWLLWHQEMPVVLSVEHPSKGELRVQSLEQKVCDCEPAETKALQQLAKVWTVQQEANAIINTAIQHYLQAKGRMPESLNALTKPFPENWVAGRSPELRAAFALITQPKGTNSSTAAGASLDSGNHNNNSEEQGVKGNRAAVAQRFFDQPLEIIVDKAQHQLALVSGHIILRSYSIGLGGVNTPEGIYHITDKVMNPNGRSNGEFGSRGMQLSDTNYAIHGTNAPDSIGKDQSLGCVRMRKDDVEELFDMVPMGTKVSIGKGNLPHLSPQSGSKFSIPDRQEQTNPRKTYHWLT